MSVKRHNGHDYMRMLRKIIDLQTSATITKEEIISKYRSLYTGADFSLTKLAHNLREYDFACEILK